MLTKEQLSRLNEQLLQRRRELISLREELDESWQQLHEKEVELEERAQKETLSQGIDHLDEQEKEELEAIDRALGRIEMGTYGICELCGRDISIERLEVIPWTALCSTCAGADEGSGQ
ncbi:MAG: TraR/DksA family transcriptional regulator [Thermodesulfobacteriota bacterium]